MGIISSDTLEGSDTLNRDAEYSDGKKRNPAKQKTPRNQDYRRVTGAWQDSAVSSLESVRVSPACPHAEQCSCGGRSSLGPCSPRAGDGAVTGRVPRGASRLGAQRPPALPSRSSGFPLFTVLVCVAAIAPRVRCCNRFP